MTTCFLRHFLTALVAAAILGSPAAAACNTKTGKLPFLAESEERSENGEDGGSFDNVELFAESDHPDILVPAGCVDRAVDESLDVKAALLMGHVVRGPPLV